MHRYLKTHPRYTYGKHHYAAADFGLDEAQEQARYASYLNRFGKYLH